MSYCIRISGFYFFNPSLSGTILTWQLENKGDWVNYSPEVNDAITAAAMVGQPCVNLQVLHRRLKSKVRWLFFEKLSIRKQET